MHDFDAWLADAVLPFSAAVFSLPLRGDNSPDKLSLYWGSKTPGTPMAPPTWGLYTTYAALRGGFSPHLPTKPALSAHAHLPLCRWMPGVLAGLQAFFSGFDACLRHRGMHYAIHISPTATHPLLLAIPAGNRYIPPKGYTTSLPAPSQWAREQAILQGHIDAHEAFVTPQLA